MCRVYLQPLLCSGPQKLPNSGIMQTTRPLRRSRSFKVTDFGTNRKFIYDFLLVINSNTSYFASLPSYGRSFVKFLLSTREFLTLTPSDPDAIQINFSSPETRRIVLPEAENRTIASSFVWTKHRNVTDRQTDGQKWSGYYSGLQCEQCGRAVKHTGVQFA